jgi:hypothetical protein
MTRNENDFFVFETHSLLPFSQIRKERDISDWPAWPAFCLFFGCLALPPLLLFLQFFERQRQKMVMSLLALATVGLPLLLSTANADSSFTGGQCKYSLNSAGNQLAVSCASSASWGNFLLLCCSFILVFYVPSILVPYLTLLNIMRSSLEFRNFNIIN